MLFALLALLVGLLLRSQVFVIRNIEVDGVESEAIEARRLVLATGVIDHLPEVPGLAERWGRHVFHCPYCHGYELNQGRLGALAVSPLSMHVALMLPDWGQATLFLNGAFEPPLRVRARDCWAVDNVPSGSLSHDAPSARETH